LPSKAGKLLTQDAVRAESEGPGGNSATMEARRLQGVVLAQRWDISGLTDQRDRARADIEQLKLQLADGTARLAEATGEAEAAQRQYDELRRLAHFGEAAINGLLREPLSPSGRLLVERALIQACGLFDEDYYRRANPVPADAADALLHYLAEGDRQGFDPHPLFSPAFYVDQLGDAAALSGSSLAHYLLRGWRAGLAPHPLFDPGFYVEQERPPPDAPPLLHFLHIGAARNAVPHPLFQPEFYRRRRGLETGHSLVLIRDFLLAGWRRGLSPHPLFDPGYYLAINQDVRDSEVNPVIHYILHGAREERSPHPLFDPVFYHRQIEASSVSGAATLTHYLTVGSRHGLRAHPLFDDAYYRERNPDVEREGVAALAHFVEFGAVEGRNPHPAFDIGYLRRSRPDLFAHEPNPVLRFLTDPNCRSVSPTILFDPAYYLRRYPDVEGSEVGPFLHFLLWGAAEGRDPHRIFDTEFYDRQVGGWRRRSTDPISDFLRFGCAEGHRPHPLFDPLYYLENNHDVRDAGINPLTHYLEFGGVSEHRSPHPLFNIEYYRRNGGELATNGRSFLEEYLNKPSEYNIDVNPAFNSAYYLNQHPELNSAKGSPLLHYINQGPLGLSDPHPLFSHSFYRKQIKNPEGISTSLLEHYFSHGYKEHLSPHETFDSQYIHDVNPGLANDGVVPLQDYLEKGLDAGYDPNSWFDGVSYNIIEQNAEVEPVNPLIHYVLCGGTHQALPPDSEKAPSELVIADPTCVDYEILRKSVAGFASAAVGGSPPASVRDVVESASARQFLADHPLSIFGSLESATSADRRGVALYAIFSDSGRLTFGHRAMLAALRSAGYATILINSSLAGGRSLREQAAPLADVTILREGGGRDFASWIAALLAYFPQISAYENCLLVNDSLIGPVADLDPVWSAFSASRADAWALTDCLQSRRHLQSSFLILRPTALTSPAFVRFISSYEFPDERYRVVQDGEIGLATALERGGLAIEAMAPYKAVVKAWLRSQVQRERWYDEIELGEPGPAAAAVIPPGVELAFARYARRWSQARARVLRRGAALNPQHEFWDTLYQDFKFPFLKKDLVTVNPLRVPSIAALGDLLQPEYRRSALRAIDDVVGSREGMPASVLRVSREIVREWRGQTKGGRHV
jgi:hypothetical protein